MEVIKSAATPEPPAVKEEEYVVLQAPEGANAVVHEGILFQVHDGLVRVFKHMEEELTGKHGFKPGKPAGEAPPAGEAREPVYPANAMQPASSMGEGNT